MSFNDVRAYSAIGGTPVPPPWTAGFWINRQDAPNHSASLLGDGSTTLKPEQFDFTRRVGFTLAYEHAPRGHLILKKGARL